MKKFLALLGTITVISGTVEFLSDSLLANKTTISIKDETKDLTEAKITELNKESQSWNDDKIDATLKDSLQYHDHQLSINKKQLDTKKLPNEVVKHLNLALTNLNNAVNNGYIKVMVKNKQVELIYPTNIVKTKKLDNNDADIVYFDSKPTEVKVKANSSYMWASAYGPSHWWKFWQWGGYIHFSKSAVFVAKIVHICALIANVVFLVKNIAEIEKIVTELKNAHNIGDTIKVNNGLKQLSRIFGGFDLNLLGEIVDILAIFTTLASFVLALTALEGWLTPLLELIAGLFATITGQMINADNGKGVKWQWAWFIIPGKISAE